MDRLLFLLGCFSISLTAKVEARVETLPGPIPADVIAVIDGDTIAVRAYVWPGHSVETRARLAGADAPETHRPACEAERARGEAAAAFVAEMLDGAPIHLHRVRLGAFAGRVIARVETEAGVDVGQALIAADLAAPYGVERDWCAQTLVEARP